MSSDPNKRQQAVARKMYRLLSRAWGPQHWWPAETPFEIIVGAILTQNTSWTNVDKALTKLRQANVLSVRGIRAVPLEELEQLVRSSGYYRQKAARLKGFVAFLDQRYGGSFTKLFAIPTEQLRTELLSLKGIGQETADAILLYAGKHEIFVVDAYARRILERHALAGVGASYNEVRALIEHALRRELPAKPIVRGTTLQRIVVHEPTPMSESHGSSLAQVYNEMHGLFVQVGKHYCYKEEPDCPHCPLRTLLPDSQFRP
jgi:endonuclease III related protein